MRVWLVAGVTDMRCGFDTLAAKVQTALAHNPYEGHVFVFRGRRGDLVKLLWSDGDGLCLLAKRLERGRFVWPQGRQRCGAADDGPTVDAARRHRLARCASHLAAERSGVTRRAAYCAQAPLR